MTTDFTTEDYWTAAKVVRAQFPTAPHVFIPIEEKAAEMAAAQARDTEAENLARVMHGCHGRVQDWENSIVKADYLREARAALEHLAPIAEWLATERVYLAGKAFGAAQRESGRVTLTADEAADVRTLLGSCIALPISSTEADSRLARLRARFAPTEQAEPKPEPRSWPSLDQVPQDVEVTDRGDDRWKFRDGQWMWLWTRKRGDQWMVPLCSSVTLCGPFTEVAEVSL